MGHEDKRRCPLCTLQWHVRFYTYPWSAYSNFKQFTLLEASTNAWMKLINVLELVKVYTNQFTEFIHFVDYLRCKHKQIRARLKTIFNL